MLLAGSHANRVHRGIFPKDRLTAALEIDISLTVEHIAGREVKEGRSARSGALGKDEINHLSSLSMYCRMAR